MQGGVWRRAAAPRREKNMITREQYETAREQTIGYLSRAGIALTTAEAERIEVADVGLGTLSSFLFLHIYPRRAHI
jgi:hypothetical protein